MTTSKMNRVTQNQSESSLIVRAVRLISPNDSELNEFNSGELKFAGISLVKGPRDVGSDSSEGITLFC